MSLRLSLIIIAILGLLSCDSLRLLKEYKSIAFSGIRINPTLILNDHNQTVSRRYTVNGNSITKKQNQVPVANIRGFQESVSEELVELISKYKVLNRIDSRLLSNERPLSNDELNSLTTGISEDALLDIYVELSIENDQYRFYDSDTHFVSERVGYHWVNRVGESKPSRLKAILYITIFDSSTKKSINHTAIVEADSSDVTIVWTDLSSINAMDFKWFDKLKTELTNQLQSLLFAVNKDS